MTEAPVSAPGPPDAPADLKRLDRRIAAGLGILLLLVLAAFGYLESYKRIPGRSGATPAQWPAASGIARGTERPCLVLFAHPHCACTRASLAEFRALMSQAAGRADAHVLFLLPDGAESRDTHGELWRTAASIPGVRVAVDPERRESRRFGALTSGHVVLYDVDGRLLFSGGITGARGHLGDNQGRRLLAASIREEQLAGGTHPVFGCELEDPETGRKP